MSNDVAHPAAEPRSSSGSRRRGQSVELVPFQEDEDYALLAEWCGSPVGTYVHGSPELAGAEQMKAVVTSGRSRTAYLMVKTLDGAKVGAVEWQPKRYADSYTFGIVVGSTELWGRGYGMEAGMLGMEMLFHESNAHRVELITGTYNRQMMEIMTSGLIHVEGVLRDYYFVDGEYHDAVVGSILRREYYDRSANPSFRPRDMIPASEKQQARGLLRKYLSEHPVVQ